jgi:signal peptidase II
MKIKNKNLFFSAGILGLAFFVLDRIFKNLVLAGKIFGVKNYGLALSINFNRKFFEIIFWLLSSVVIFLLVYLIIQQLRPHPSASWRTLLIKERGSYPLLLITYYLLLLGASSNLLDRLKFGFVIDYINFHFFYNNLADIMIWIGIIIYLVGVWYNKTSDCHPESR